MKKGIKIGLIIAVVLAVLIGAFAIAISPIAQNYIEKHDHELIGRTIRMERLRANIFTGRLRVEGLHISGADDSTTFFTLDSFDMRIRLLPLLFHRVDVPYVHFRTPNVKVYQLGNQFNFDGILDHFASDSTEVEEPTKQWEIGVYDIQINNGELFYKDLALGATWGLQDINLQIPGVYFSGKKTDVGAVLNFAEGGSLSTQVAYDIESSAFDIRLQLQQLKLQNTLPYLQQYLHVNDVKGDLSADVRLHGDTEHLMSLQASGTAGISGFALVDPSDRDVVAVDTLGVQLAMGDLQKQAFRFDRLYTSGVSARIELTNEENNLLALLKEDEPNSAATETNATATAQPEFSIGDFEIKNSRITLRDNTLHRPFEYVVSNIRMHSREFNPAATNNLTIDAQMQKTGSAKFRWEGSLTDLNNHNIMLTLTNLNVSDFSPYCEHYTAYPLTHGNLSFRSQNVIRNRNLEGTNHLDMYEPKADKKLKEIKPEMHIPLRLGLYVLKDKKGHITMDLPVRGSLDSPEFSYRKIVLRAIGNVLLKVVTAPFSFLSGGNRPLEYIAVDPQQYAFTSEQYASFDQIATMLKEKPELQIALTQRINLRRALPEQATAALKLAYANAQRGSDSLTMSRIDTLMRSQQADKSHQQMTLLEYEKIMQTDVETPAIVAFADTLLQAQGLPLRGSIEEKALVLYRQQATEQLQRLHKLRNSTLVKYMQTAHEITAPRFEIAPADSVSLDTYTGKDRYTIAIGVEGETVEVGEEKPAPAEQ